MMKYLILFFSLVFSVFSVAQEKPKNLSENVLITSQKDKTQVQTNENGELLVNVSPKDASSFKAKGLVRYSDFGARGDGKTDDIDAIAAAHAFANQHGLLVKANDGTSLAGDWNELFKLSYHSPYLYCNPGSAVPESYHIRTMFGTRSV